MLPVIPTGGSHASTAARVENALKIVDAGARINIEAVSILSDMENPAGGL
ncbi:MAG TPA: hypothetical protein VHE11_06295 [Steroidobacteraceae bacterium]|nr:hypothetical protein [Steroidobacteraceae bacterium]